MTEPTAHPTKPLRTWRPMAAWTAGILLVLGGWLIGCGGYPFVYWSPLNCKYEDLDIRTGRIRKTRMLVWLKVSERIEDSAVTKVLTAEDLGGAEPEWHKVNTFSPGVGHSPHYVFHGAIHQIRELEDTWKTFPVSPCMKREIALTVLGLWKEKGNDYAAGLFVNDLCCRLYMLADERTDESVRSAAASALKKIRGEEAVPERRGDTGTR